MTIYNTDNAMSLVRSVLKIGGALAISAGFSDSEHIGAITSNLEVLIGTAMTLIGLVMSLWEHTPDEIPLRTLAPESIPADVAAKIAEHTP